MPRYDVECQKCGEVKEVDCAAGQKDELSHIVCGGQLKVVWLKAPSQGAPRHQTHAVFSDPVTGKVVSKVPGLFGKDSPVDKLKQQKRIAKKAGLK